MEEKLKEILDRYSADIDEAEKQCKKLMDYITFCDKHKFEEEARIARIKFEARRSITYNWESMYNKLKEMLNAWNQ